MPVLQQRTATGFTGPPLRTSGDHEMTAHVVRFWRGESVLEITVAGAGARWSSMSKVSRRLTTEHEPILAGYLTDALQTG